MAKEKNPAIGELPCPFKGCEHKASVHRYRERSGDEKMRRFAGRVYAICERKHRCEDQEFILENATIWGAQKNAASAPEPAAVAPVKSSENPAPAPVRKAPEPPVPEESKAAQPAVAALLESTVKQKGWGWFT